MELSLAAEEVWENNLKFWWTFYQKYETTQGISPMINSIGLSLAVKGYARQWVPQLSSHGKTAIVYGFSIK